MLLCDPILTNISLIFGLKRFYQYYAILFERLDGVAFNISLGVVYKAKYFYLIVNKAIKLFCNIS
jgi:hypothetical protein